MGLKLGKNLSQHQLLYNIRKKQNLTPAKKILLHWHGMLGHRNLRDESEQFPAYSKISFEDGSLYEICQYAKKRRKDVHRKLTKIDPTSEGNRNNDHLRHGESISVDHFESRMV